MQFEKMPQNNLKTETGVPKKLERQKPVIKQTLTSMYRMLKANPLLLQSNKEQDINNFKLPKSVYYSSSKLNTGESLKSFTNNDFSANINKLKRSATERKPEQKVKLSLKSRPQSVRLPLKTSQPINTVKQPPKSEIKNCIKAPFAVPTARNLPKKNPTRRSLSAEHFERKKVNLQGKMQHEKVVKKNINNNEVKTDVVNITGVSPIIQDTTNRRVTFKSPMAYRRRSKSFTSSTTPYYAKSQYMAFASTPRFDNDLHSRLERWLQNHRKPVESYHHLKCFSMKHFKPNNEVEEENKENIEVDSPTSSYEDLKIKPCGLNFVTPVKSVRINANNTPVDIRNLACSALNDLHKLIVDGYSNEQCEAWLGMIRQKYDNLEDEPQYWECRAAIEQTRGNLTSAVECLRTAIVQGAEIKTVDHSLEQLFDKFSLLNINDAEHGNGKKDRVRIMCDARNVFKSSIIQFAVQERTLKKKKNQEDDGSVKKFVATPVRRSTRRRTQYVLTPGVQLCSSLQDLESSVRDHLSFETNSALSVKYP